MAVALQPKVEKSGRKMREHSRDMTLISTLPKEEGLTLKKHLYQCQGFWFPDFFIREVMAIQDHFKARSTDIFFATTPNYGTKWIEAILISTVTRSMNFNHNDPLLPNDVPYLFPSLDLIVYHKRIFPNLENIPRLLRVNIPYSLLQPCVIKSSCRIVYVCRNPKDVFSLFWNFANRFREQRSKPPLTAVDAIESFCRGRSHFRPFWDHVLEYRKASLESPEQVLFLKFEQMKAKPTLYLKRLAQFVGFPFTLQERKEWVVDYILRSCKFKNSIHLELEDDIYFREGGVRNSENHLTSEMIERLDQITEEKFRGSGLKL